MTLNIPRTVFHAHPQIVCDDAAEITVGIPLHFGDPSGEQWAIEAGEGILDRLDLAAVVVSGPDRQTWLTSLASQNVTGMGPGDSREILILDPNGHIEYAAAALDDGENTWLITARSHAEKLAQWLISMQFMLRVHVCIREDIRLFSTAHKRSREAITDCAGYLMTWEDPWPGVLDGGASYFSGDHPASGLHMMIHVVTQDAAHTFAHEWIAAGQKRRPAGFLAWNAMRVAAWKPDIASEVDERTIPAELDWLRTAVHTKKGCYRGQESVARVLNLGRPPRRCVFLQLDGFRGDLPASGARITFGGRVVGRVTSSARHADMGPIALAVIARNVPADAVLDIDGVAAAQELIVPLDGKSSVSPRERPGANLRNPLLRRPDTPALGGGGVVAASGGQ
ncbi:CAF17-like 4Fe-4S cluster assembly/insertion protein YgfZ [Schaalia sp. lx-260]|uniref:CAF17-like 4Fe-4S cluster assembly/insertion protein YgfZ n=1 Tax=Schaalia sp. lx-260 TaxID=2899082 RepID=UPI001E5447E6|nr:folate-binding protein [Schaalia sp. lx-260]MCD4549949.1 folate-binding protein [Schaalia sp. lx-260]